MKHKFWLNQITIFVVLIAIFSLTSCSTKPQATAVVVPTDVSILFDVSPKVNPNTQGRPSPIFVRIYRLKNSVAFLASDYFSLVQKDQSVLGADIVFREEIMLSPGQSQTLKKKWLAEPGYFAVVAAYRDLDKSVWRAIQPLNVVTSYAGDKQPEQTISVTLDSRTLTVR